MLFETSLTTPVFGLRRDVNRLFDEMMNRALPTSAWTPPVDVREDKNELVVSIELPGIDPNAVEVTSEEGVLTVRGEKRAERKEDEGEYHLVERSYGSFTRSFRLPNGIDDSKISADFEHGVLRIHVPKAALPQPKKIAINAGADNGRVQQKAVGTGEQKTAQRNEPRHEPRHEQKTAR